MSYAANAYAKTSRSVLTAREAESAVLTKASQRLQMVRDDWANQSGELVAALNFNQKVWAVIAGAAAEPDCPLPEPIKASIVQLSVFVFRRMVDTLIEPEADKLSALISINHNLAAGLRS